MSVKQCIPRIKIIGGKTFNNSPHLVILGAGASIACIGQTPNGKKLPSMNDLFYLEGVKEIIKKYSLKIEKGESFEMFFSRLFMDKHVAIKDLEDYIYNYFSDMEIAPTPNLYDKLILSLRGKDTIATFNWDPLLLLSYARHKEINEDDLPDILFLHGNVAEGKCCDCKVLCNYYNKICHNCYKEQSRSKLLYPVGKKDYNSDVLIKQNWDKLKNVLSRAYIVTIFGYSAPESDIEAKNIFINARTESPLLEQGEIEIINTEDRIKIEETWKNLFFSRNYCIFNKLESSWILKHPRRSCDAMASAYLQQKPIKENPFLDFKTIKEMYDFIKPLITEEVRLGLE